MVAHPDGRLGDYLDSLRRLHALTVDGGVDTVLPGPRPGAGRRARRRRVLPRAPRAPARPGRDRGRVGAAHRRPRSSRTSTPTSTARCGRPPSCRSAPSSTTCANTDSSTSRDRLPAPAPARVTDTGVRSLVRVVRRRPLPGLRGAARGRPRALVRADGPVADPAPRRRRARCCGTGGWAGRTCTASPHEEFGRRAAARRARAVPHAQRPRAARPGGRPRTPGSAGWCPRRSPRAPWSGWRPYVRRLAGDSSTAWSRTAAATCWPGRRAAAGRRHRRDARHPGRRPGAAAALVGGDRRHVRAEPGAEEAAARAVRACGGVLRLPARR